MWLQIIPGSQTIALPFKSAVVIPYMCSYPKMDSYTSIGVILNQGATAPWGALRSAVGYHTMLHVQK